MKADVCGIGAIERFGNAPKGFSPTDIYDKCKSVIAFGVALPRGLMQVEPRLLYGHFNGAVSCAKVDEIAFFGAKEIERRFGGTAVPVPCDEPNEYWEPENLTAKGVLSMKHAAVLCGIGQLGKSSLLLNPKFGNLLTIGVIFTDMELESDEPCENICMDGCSRCVDSCPVYAIENGSVRQERCRPNTYGKTARGFATVDCNKCRGVCPMRFGR